MSGPPFVRLRPAKEAIKSVEMMGRRHGTGNHLRCVWHGHRRGTGRSHRNRPQDLQGASAVPEAGRPPGEALDGIPRAIVSDADHAFLEGILKSNRLRFDAVITSESVRAYKPRPQIFQAALKVLRASPAEVVHVGDSLNEDVAGASRVGMRTIWVNRGDVHRTAADPKPDAEVRDLAGLPDTIERVLDPASTAPENRQERRPRPSAYRVK